MKKSSFMKMMLFVGALSVSGVCSALTVTLEKSGNGRVYFNENPASGNTLEVASGNPFSIHAIPDEGSTFVDWFLVVGGERYAMEWDAETYGVTTTRTMILSAEFTGSTGMETPEQSATYIYGANGTVYGAENGRIYTVAGQDVTEQNGCLSGFYIVKANEKVQKVFVK